MLRAKLHDLMATFLKDLMTKVTEITQQFLSVISKVYELVQLKNCFLITEAKVMKIYFLTDHGRII